MGQFLIQPEKERNLYILWSTITDSPIVAGDRKTLEAAMLVDRIESAKRDISYMFDIYCQRPNADGEEEGKVYQGSHWLPARNLLAVAERIEKDPDADLTDLVEEIEDDRQIG
jgi:hypothetical protein